MNKKILGVMASLFLASCTVSDTPKLSHQQSKPVANAAAISDPGHYSLIATPGQNAQFWDIAKQKLLYQWNHDPQTAPHMTALAITPDEKSAVTADQHQIVLWNVETGRIDGFMHISNRVLDISTNTNGLMVLVGLERNKAELLDIRHKKTVAELPHEGQVSTVWLSDDGQLALTGSHDKSAQLWDLKTKTVIHRWMHTKPVKTVALSPKNLWVFTGAGKGEQRIWDAKTGSLILRLDPKALSSNTAVFSQDDKWLAVGRSSGILQLWDVNAQSLIQEWHVPTSKILAIGFSPDKHSIYTEDSSGMFSVWGIKN